MEKVNFKNSSSTSHSWVIPWSLCVCSVVFDSFVTPWTVAFQAPLFMGFSSKSTGVGCHSFLQGIFATQGMNLWLLCLLYWKAHSLPLVLPGKSVNTYSQAITSYFTLCYKLMFNYLCHRTRPCARTQSQLFHKYSQYQAKDKHILCLE